MQSCILSEACCRKAGTDVARKVVILARECNLKVELHDVEVQSLVPEPLRDSPSADAFLEGLPQVILLPLSTLNRIEVPRLLTDFTLCGDLPGRPSTGEPAAFVLSMPMGMYASETLV